MKTGVFTASWLFYFCSALYAGDAVAVGYNPEGIWTAVMYYCSSTPPGGADYKTAGQARESALRDLRLRAGENLATAKVIADSDRTGYFAVACGKRQAGKDLIVVGYGKSQREADQKALQDLKHGAAKTDPKILYRYFSHGSSPATDR